MRKDRKFGHRLRVARIALELSEKDAAASCEVSLRTYRKYESGCLPKFGTPIVSFAVKHDVSLDWIYLGDRRRIKRHLAIGQGKIAILPARVTYQ